MKKMILIVGLMLFTNFLFALNMEQDDVLMRAIISDGAVTVPGGTLAMEVHGDIKNIKFLYDPTYLMPDSGDEFEFKLRRFNLNFGFHYGFSDNFEASLKGSWKDSEETNYNDPWGNMISSGEFDNTELLLKYRFSNNDSFADIAIAGGVSIDTSDQGKFLYITNALPSAKTSPFNTGGVNAIIKFLFNSELERGAVQGSASYTYTGKFTNRYKEKENPGDIFEYNVGYIYPVTEVLRTTLEVNVFKMKVTKINGMKQPLTDLDFTFISPGLQYSPSSNFIIEAAYMYPVSSTLPFEKSPHFLASKRAPWYRFGFFWLF